MNKNDISKVQMTIIVDHTAKTTTVKQTGIKPPLSFVQSASGAAYCAALRDAAFYLLDLAGDVEGAVKTRDQIRVMWEEHRMFNEPALK